MNLKYLGDALDHWKGSLLEQLRESDALRGLAVDPMASDLSSWAEGDFALFARLLRVSRSQIVQHQFGLKERSQYFAEIEHRDDLFLDPDTGIATGRVKDPAQYLKPAEVARLLMVSADRLIIVYQHVRAQAVSGRVDAVLGVLKCELSKFAWCSYESGTVAMVFLAQSVDRTTPVASCFRKLLGRHAVSRIRDGAF